MLGMPKSEGKKVTALNSEASPFPFERLLPASHPPDHFSPFIKSGFLNILTQPLLEGLDKER